MSLSFSPLSPPLAPLFLVLWIIAAQQHGHLTTPNVVIKVRKDTAPLLSTLRAFFFCFSLKKKKKSTPCSGRLRMRCEQRCTAAICTLASLLPPFFGGLRERNVITLSRDRYVSCVVKVAEKFILALRTQIAAALVFYSRLILTAAGVFLARTCH